ncbi:MAG: Abi family protein [Tissierellia bacterium]|nr:Abi family protein [Tissierellia bacterium]
MSNQKVATTYEQQIDILIERGCQINDKNFCKEKLSCINYYRLTAYFLPFKTKDDKYVPGTSFEKIYYIYEFDRKLRNIIYNAIEVIEISLRSRLSYLHAHKYGPLGYLNAENFNKRHNFVKFHKNIKTEINRNKEVSFVKHHLKKYGGQFPIWVIIELFSFGMISYFYSDLKTQDQKLIAKEFGVNYGDLKSWLRCLTDLRNICAHYGRLYYKTFSASPANIDLSENEKRRLWGLFLVLKNIYPDTEKWNIEFLPNLENLFMKYENYIDLYHIAFPKDWLSQLQK